MVQYIEHTQSRGKFLPKSDIFAQSCPFRVVFLVAGLLLCAIAASFTFQPTVAYAKSYEMPKVDISAQVQDDGSLHVIEQRTFDFNGDFTAIWFTINPPYGGELKINSVSMANPAATPAGQPLAYTPLKEAAFNLAWREAGGPGKESYSFDSPKNTAYVFFNVDSEQRTISIDYTVQNALGVYKDVGELYWQYVGTEWAEASSDVTMTLGLPVPAGITVTPGDNVRAWGHGPLDGSLAINTDGSITYRVPRVSAGQFAEARVVFPVSWLQNVPVKIKALHQDESRLETVLADEQNWADQANQQRSLSLFFVVACGVISVLVLVWAVLMFLRHGKEHKPRFTEQYWRDVPSPEHHPAEIGRLWRFDKESPDDLVATIMHLAHLGAIKINQGSYETSTTFGNKQVDDFYLTRVSKVENTLSDSLDRAAMEFLFDKVADGKDALWMGGIKVYGKDHPEDFISAMQAWQGALTARVNADELFEAKGARLQMTMVSVSIVFAALGIAAAFFLENFIPLLFVIPVAIATFVMSNFMTRRSQETADLNARCEALRNWLKDFSSLDERPPTDVKVWGEFMVYAYIFGVAQEAMKNLQNTVPEMFVSDRSEVSAPGFVPWWFWYGSAHGSYGSVMPSAGDFLGSAMTNTISTATAAISAAQGSSSSGSGFGGGFSGGGGGGFGGGGGAR